MYSDINSRIHFINTARGATCADVVGRVITGAHTDFLLCDRTNGEIRNSASELTISHGRSLNTVG